VLPAVRERQGLAVELGRIMAQLGLKRRAVDSRYSIVDEQDLADAGQAYARFLERATSVPRKVARLPVPA